MNNMLKSFKVGFLFLSAVIFIFTVIPQNASASVKSKTNEELFESLGGLDQETLDMFNELDKYRIELGDGSFKLDTTTAELEGVQPEVLNVINIVNVMAKDVDAEISPFALFPIGSYGNYCGKGNNGYDKTPIDNLDSACRDHDKCFKGWNDASIPCNQVFVGKLMVIVQATSAISDKGAYARAALYLFKEWI